MLKKDLFWSTLFIQNFKFMRTSILMTLVCLTSYNIVLGHSDLNNDPTTPSSTCDNISCEPGFYQTADNDGKLYIYDFDGQELGFTLVTTFGFRVNATAFNIQDGLLYTISRDDGHLIQFDTNGSWVDLGDTNINDNLISGSFDNSGNFYVVSGSGRNIYRIDVTTNTFVDVPISTNVEFDASDFVYVECENKFYGVGRDGFLYVFDLVDSSVTSIALSGLNETGAYGAAFTDVNGTLYVSNNSSGNIYRIDFANNAATFLITGPSVGVNDGASCPCAEAPFPSLFPEDDFICIDNDGDAVAILENDLHSFSNIDNSSFTIVVEPSNGNLSYSEENGTIFYLSDDQFVADSFVYNICLDLEEQFCEDATVYFLPATEMVINESICEGEEVEYDGVVYTEAGIHEFEFMGSTGCDSVVRLNIEVNPSFDSLLVVETCGESEFVFDGMTYTESDIYEFDFTTAQGCDSSFVLDLSLNPSFSETINQSICEGGSFVFDDVSYEEEGIFSVEYLTQAGCDSIYTIFLTVNKDTLVTLTESICDDSVFELNGITYSETGVYTQDLNTINGCDSTISLDLVVLDTFDELIEVTICEGTEYVLGTTAYSIAGMYEEQFVATNGCDSLVTLDLKVAPTFNGEIRESFCDGEVFMFNNTAYTEGGDFDIFIDGEGGCDSIINLVLTKFDDAAFQLNPIICDGEVFMSGTTSYTEAGMYTENLFTSNGCDSIVTIDLIVNSNFEFFITDEICLGEEIIVGNEVFEEAGVHEVLFTARNGCDSLVTLELTVNQPALTNLAREICDGEEITIGSTSYNTAGIHNTTLSTAQGCDSLVILDLVVHAESRIVETASICDSEVFEFAGQIFDETGIYEVPLVSSKGCDSLMILDLIVNEEFTTTLSESICIGSSFVVGDSTYTQPGFYTNQFTTINGCDSIVELNLAVSDIATTNLNENLCEGESTSIGTEVFSETGLYEVMMLGDSGCDSLVILDLVVSENFEFEFDREICEGEVISVGASLYDSTGTYVDALKSVNGCDSIIVTHLVVYETSEEQIEMLTCLEEMLGQEVLTLSNSNGCDSIVIINTMLSPSSECAVVVSVEGMVIPCMESLGSIALNVLDGTPPFAISWSGPTSGMEIFEGLGMLTISDLLPGNYTVEILDANNNIAEVAAEVSESDTPNLESVMPLSNSGFSIDCNGFANGTASVIATGGTTPYTYAWSNGETTQEIQDLNSGLYSVTLTDANDCIVITEIEITEPPALEQVLDPIDLNCDDESGLVFIDVTGGVSPYSYSLNGGTIQSENTFMNLEEGNYSSVVMDANGCVIEEEFTLEKGTAVLVELGEDLSIELGDIVQLNAQLNLPGQNIDSIIWSDNLETDCGDCLLQSFFPSESGTYSVYVVDDNGCSHIDEITINVDTEQTIYVPNVFSPNGDGVNDGFTLYSNARFSPIISELHVYDRWGTEVFARFDFSPNEEILGWNGSYRGEDINTGVFVYHATVEFIDGSRVFYEGDVTLVR